MNIHFSLRSCIHRLTNPNFNFERVCCPQLQIFCFSFTAFTGQISVENTTEIVYLQSVSFVCTATGDDVYTMDWYFTSTTHTTPILLGTGNGVTAEGFTVGDSTGVFTLTVQSYGEDRDGTYQCSVNRATKQGNITTNAGKNRFHFSFKLIVIINNFIFRIYLKEIQRFAFIHRKYQLVQLLL